MNDLKKFLIVLFVLTLPTTAFASAKANLDLWKRSLHYGGPCGHCAPLLSFSANKDRSSFSEYSLDGRSGYYTINLTGPKGTAVTLFGREDFSTENGYLIIMKEDNESIEINDLEMFSPGVWTKVESPTGGSYSAFYLPHQNFKSLIASIQWGKGPKSGTGK
jgi:hypothetical protein